MASFACPCGTGTITGSATPSPDPTYTFTCDNHAGAGSHEIAEAQVVGTPPDVEKALLAFEQDIKANWDAVDNPVEMPKLMFTVIM